MSDTLAPGAIVLALALAGLRIVVRRWRAGGLRSPKRPVKPGRPLASRVAPALSSIFPLILLAQSAITMLVPQAEAQTPPSGMPPSSSLIYVGTNGSGLIDRISGGTWHQVIGTAGPPGTIGGPHDLTVVNAVVTPIGLANVLYIYGTDSGSVRKAYRSENGGDQWTLIADSPGSTNYIAARPGQDVLYALSAGQIYKSTGGASWTALAGLGPYTDPAGPCFVGGATSTVTGFVLPNVPGSTRIWFNRVLSRNSDGTGCGTLHYSDDEGTTWRGGYQAALSSAGASIFGSPDPNRAFEGYNNGTVDRWDISQSGATEASVGVSQSSQGSWASSTRDHTVFSTPGLICSCTGVYVSEDGGQTSALATGSSGLAVSQIAYDYAAPADFWLIMPSSTIAYSVDRGANWTTQATGFASSLSLAVAAGIPTEAAIVGTDRNFNPNAGTSPDPVNSSNGAFAQQRTDIAIAGRGPSPTFTRSYSSNDTRIGPLGPGWTFNYNARLRSPGGGSTDLILVSPEGRSDRYTTTDGIIYTPPSGILTNLVRQIDGTYVATHKDQSTWLFDLAGRLIAMTDRYGNRSMLGYDATGRLATIGDPAGRGSLTLSYDSTDRIQSVTDWLVPARTVQYQYDSSGRLWKVTDRENKTTTYTYDGSSSRVTSVTDANTHVMVTNTYDSQGRVATQKDAQGLTTGQATTFSYTVNGDGTMVTVITLPTTSYESSFHPTITDSYDASGRLTSRVTTPSSSSSETISGTNTYDAHGNVATTTDSFGQTTRFCYDVDEHGAAVAGSQNNLTRRIDPAPASGGNAFVTLYRYDSKNNLTRIISPLGVNSGPSVTCSTDLSAGLNTTTYATTMLYDGAGVFLLSRTRMFTDPTDGLKTAVTTYEYDSAQPGLVSYITPPRGNTGSSPDRLYSTHFTYFSTSDPSKRGGLIASMVDPLNNTVSFDYDAVGRRISMVDALGNAPGGVALDHTWRYEFDKEDRQRYVRAPAPVSGGSQLVTETRYDAVGNPIAVIDAIGQATKYKFDERDNLAEVWESPQPWADPDTTPSPKYVTTYSYDALNSLIRVTRAQGDVTYERVTDYVHDGLGRARKEIQYPAWPMMTGPLTSQTAYDANGNQASVIDPLGQTTSYSYDRLNRLVGVNYSDPGTPDVTYAYDANSNLGTMQDGTGKTAYCYDELSRLLSVTTGLTSGASVSCPNVTGGSRVGHRYDLDGHRKTLIYPNGDTVAYSYDNAGRMTSLTDWASQITGYDYYPDSALKKQTNVNNTVTELTYDNARRLTDIWNKPSAASTNAITRHQLTLDAVGNRTQVIETLAPIPSPPLQPAPGGLPTGHPMTPASAPIGLPTGHALTPTTAPSGLPSRPGISTVTQTLTYGYDRLYRLTSVTGGPIGSRTYCYDPVGNRLDRIQGSTTASCASPTYTYDRADRIMTAGSTSYGVNANGNTVSRGIADAFDYDQANRLTKLKDPSTGSARATYTYDGAGKRTSATVGGVTSGYVYDTNHSLPALLEDNGHRYVWGLGPAYEIEAGTVRVYHSDGLGSVRALTDLSANVTQTYQTDEFGVPVSANGASQQPLDFTGEQHDRETGLIYLRSRFYDPGIGRMMTRDAYFGRASSPKSLNRYVYAQQNPCSMIDPSGYSSRQAKNCGPTPQIPGVPMGVDANALLQQNIEIARLISGLTLPGEGLEIFYERVRAGGVWDYKYWWGSSSYGDFGNFNFGVVAAAWGYTHGFATWGAGVAQQQKNAQNRREGRPELPSEGDSDLRHLSAPYGDDPQDYEMIGQGYQYFVWFRCMTW